MNEACKNYWKDVQEWSSHTNFFNLKLKNKEHRRMWKLLVDRLWRMQRVGDNSRLVQRPKQADSSFWTTKLVVSCC